MANIIQGGDLMLFVGGKSIAFATSHSLSINAETTDTTHKDVKGGWTTSNVKGFSWEVSSENLYSNDGEGVTYGDLFDYMTSKTELQGIFGLANGDSDEVPEGGWTPKYDVTDEYYQGKVIITSLQTNANAGDNATFTVSFKGVGKLEHHKAQ